MNQKDLNKVVDEGFFNVRTIRHHDIGFLRLACKTHHYRAEFDQSWAVLVPATWSKEPRVKLTLSVKDSTKQLLQECAGGPRKVGVLIDRLVEELLTRSKVENNDGE